MFCRFQLDSRWKAAGLAGVGMSLVASLADPGADCGPQPCTGEMEIVVDEEVIVEAVEIEEVK